MAVQAIENVAAAAVEAANADAATSQTRIRVLAAAAAEVDDVDDDAAVGAVVVEAAAAVANSCPPITPIH